MTIISRNTISIEETIGAQREIEYSVYGLVKDINEITAATDIIRQFQWVLYEQNNQARGNIRIRMINDTEFVRTIKYKKNEDNQPGKNELTKPSDAEEFAYFIEIAQSGMYKDRYIFPIPGTDMKWEVDCFIQPDGSYAPWVKFDLEYKDKLDIPEDLKFPIGISEVLKPGVDVEKLDAIYKEFVTIPAGTQPSAFKVIPLADLKAKLTA